MQHAQRWITTIILAPLILWILIKGTPILLAALVFTVAACAIREYLRIIFSREHGPVSLAIKTISYITCFFLVAGAGTGSWQFMFLVLALNFILLSVFVLFRFASQTHVFDIIARQVLGIVYIPLSLSFLLFLRNAPDGIFWVLWLLVVCFINDTGAFYTGSYLGKNKLSPHISPNKTIEGSLGGIAAAMTAGVVGVVIFFGRVDLALVMLPCAFLIAVAGQIGDLFESALKRASDIKDSGRILPGHGGMLDRIDGLLLAIPVLYGYLMVVV
ncbi:MAG TPA: phosphatidate cytidylyltransferase [Desulfotignum sp.]|nr:phosphatidate cytidylyltransferase [Desulfotignum sp.]